MQSLPNILFILIDDLGWRDLGCYGSTYYQTPNLDRLASQGMRFTDAYAACPVCSPTRASLLTGKYPATLGLTDWIGAHTRGRLLEVPYIDHLPLEEHNIAHALKAAGYQTWHVGKWHLGDEPYWPEKQGFDVNIGGSQWGGPIHGYFSPWKLPNLPDGPSGEYLTDRLTDDAISLIRKADRSKPFFMNLCHYAVHIPIQPPPELVEQFTTRAMEMGLDQIPALQQGDVFPCEHKKHLHIIRRLLQSDPAYAAIVFNLDQNIGRLLAALDETGQADNTLVIFTSDNGGLATAEGSPTCNAPLAEGKGWMYEGGTREPLLIRYPRRIAPNSTCSMPVTSPDFYPTLLDLANLPPLPHQHIDGTSFAPLLRGDAHAYSRGPLFWHYPHYGNQGGTPGSSIRDGDWKLIEFFEDGRLELYHLRQDVSESRNLAEAHAGIARRLHHLLTAWRQSVDARIPQPNPDWRA